MLEGIEANYLTERWKENGWTDVEAKIVTYSGSLVIVLIEVYFGWPDGWWTGDG